MPQTRGTRTEVMGHGKRPWVMVKGPGFTVTMNNVFPCRKARSKQNPRLNDSGYQVYEGRGHPRVQTTNGRVSHNIGLRLDMI